MSAPERSVVRTKDGNVWIALTKQLRWPRPARSSTLPASSSPVPGTYLITLEFAEVDGRLECVSSEIAADLDHPGGPTPVTASAVRGIPLRQLIDETLLEQTKGLRRWAKVAGGTGEAAAHLADRVAAAEASLGRAPGRPRLYSESHFKQVADAYTRAWTLGARPTKAVAVRWGISHSTAAKWIARARQLGFLPSTKRGRPRGGQPMGEATKAKAARARGSSPPATSRKLKEIERLEARQDMESQVVQRHEAWLAELMQARATPSPRAARSTADRGGARAKGATRTKPKKR